MLLQGPLRAVQIVLHLRARRLLSADQVTAKNAARGPGAAAGAQTHRRWGVIGRT